MMKNNELANVGSPRSQNKFVPYESNKYLVKKRQIDTSQLLQDLKSQMNIYGEATSEQITKKDIRNI